MDFLFAINLIKLLFNKQFILKNVSRENYETSANFVGIFMNIQQISL